MLDQLATAVAIFDEHQKLKFYNNGFQQFWNLEPSFLESNPSNGELLDRLREGKLLPEHPDWRKWREEQLSIYKSVNPEEEWWHLLDGQTVRVVVSPRPEGGVSWIFENVTEQLALESNYNSLIQIQGETLDHLNEAVAVFGSDGRLKLFNPALEKLWGDADLSVDKGLHIAKIIEGWTSSISNEEHLEKILGKVTGFDDTRDEISGQIGLNNGTHLYYMLVPLPDGQSMLTIADITANVNIERMLKERAQALEESDLLKNKFIQHVSYELRAPLTNIAGFGEMLASPHLGSLNEKQHEYVGHINSSANILRTIVDDILDLASIDAGTMELKYSLIDLEEICAQVAKQLSSALNAKAINLEIDLATESHSIFADRDRMTQVLANLITNAIGFSPDGGTVSISASTEDNSNQIRVIDQGPGIATKERDAIFDRFETRTTNGMRTGAGLGLSIVKSFVELHGGTIEIENTQSKGACFTINLPIQPQSQIGPGNQDGSATAA